MRKLLLLLFIASALLACEKSDRKKADPAEVMAEASQIVAYTNDAVEYLNTSSEWIRANKSKIDSLLEYIKSNSEPRQGIILKPEVHPFLKGTISQQDSMFISDEEKNGLKLVMGEYSSKYTAMRTNISALNKYMKKEEYLFDNYEGGRMMTDSIQYYLNYLADNKKLLSKKIEEVSEKAAAIILENHPLKEPIEEMKAEMSNFDALYDAFYAYNLGKTDAQQVESVYQLTTASVAKGKTAHTTLISGNRKAAYYNSFYTSCDAALNTFEDALGLIRAGKKLPDNTFDQFNKNLNLIVNSYNKFVE